MTLPAYPLRCQPYFRDYLWGGRNLESRLGKKLPGPGIWAESWELIDHVEHSSLILNGALSQQTIGQVIQSMPAWLLGDQLQTLPLLLKYLDCQKVLSVQVHPDDAFAQQMTPPDLGKTEAWYIIDSQPGSILYAGLKRGIDRAGLSDAIKAGTVEEVLHAIEPKPGDCIFIPAGTVHALGAGLLVAEIQQASNTTFRLFDWNRTGSDGKPRPLHIEQSLQVTDFVHGPREVQTPTATWQLGRQRLVQCDKFCLDRLSGEHTLQLGGDARFHFVTTFTGGVTIEGEGFCESIAIGESLLLPAALAGCTATFQSQATLLDMYVESDR
jgi:mannose-6-phosphate isomerase